MNEPLDLLDVLVGVFLNFLLGAGLIVLRDLLQLLDFRERFSSGVADGDDKSKVDKWTMGKLAELLTMLKNTPDTQGTMLDNTVVLWGNHMEDGASHGATKIPWIIAGPGVVPGRRLATKVATIDTAVVRDIATSFEVEPRAGQIPGGSEFESLQAGETAQDVFTYTVTDGRGRRIPDAGLARWLAGHARTSLSNKRFSGKRPKLNRTEQRTSNP